MPYDAQESGTRSTPAAAVIKRQDWRCNIWCKVYDFEMWSSAFRNIWASCLHQILEDFLISIGFGNSFYLDLHLPLFCHSTFICLNLNNIVLTSYSFAPFSVLLTFKPLCIGLSLCKKRAYKKKVAAYGFLKSNQWRGTNMFFLEPVRRLQVISMWKFSFNAFEHSLFWTALLEV